MTLPEQLIKLAEAHPEVIVLWLYGSQAKGNAGPASDWDLAVAFNPVKLPDPLDNRLRPELLALDWQQALGLSLTRYQAELLELCTLLSERPLSNLEYRAAAWPGTGLKH